jgi:NAD-dependent DNA ligase
VTEINNETCRKAKLGEITTDSVMSYLANNPKIFDIKLKQCEVQITNQTKATVCITGSLKDFKNRKDATEFLEKAGYKVTSSITKDVSILICEDESKINSSSYKKALEKNLTITTIFNLINEEAK